MKSNYSDFKGDLSNIYLYAVILWKNQNKVLVFNLGRNQKSIANVDFGYQKWKAQ